MEAKYVIVPFEVELAKKITDKSVEGRIVTKKGYNVRIVCFDVKGKAHILGLIDKEDREGFQCYDERGKVPAYEYNELELMLEIPEYITFKDGDVIAYDNVKDVFFIIGSKCSMTDENPHYYVKYEKGYLTFGTEDSFCRLKYSRLASESEKQKLIDALKASKDQRAKECLKKLGIEVKQECEFKPFDKVLVKDDYENSAWSCNLFSGKNEDGTYMCIGGYWDMCIPYNEQTAHLLGTTENYE